MRPDGTECEGGALLCHNGLCTKSICTKYALKPCECKDMKEECHACCIDDGVCRSAYKIDEVHICIGPGGILCPSLFIWVVDLYVTAAPPWFTMIHHQNTLTMFLACALVRGIHPPERRPFWIFSGGECHS
jgi:hypothetical protein